MGNPIGRRGVLALLLLAALALPGGPLHAGVAEGWPGWLPPNINSAYGEDIDGLYLIIMYLVLAMLVLTEGALLVSMVLFRRRPGHTARYSHGSPTAELFWSVVPAIILVWLALVQTDTWDKARERFPKGPQVYRVQVLAEQFSWNFRYPGADGAFGTRDDVHDGTLVVPVGREVVISLASKDVIHSLFLPHLRVKQDAVPGLRVQVWFVADSLPVWDLQKQALALVSPQAFDEALVAVGGFDFQETKVADLVRGDPWDASKGLWKGLKKFHYEASGDMVQIRQGGATDAGAPGEATHVAHWLDVACAELCGLGHYRMKSRLFIWPPAMVQDWLASKAGEGVPRDLKRKWKRIYDEGHPHWNEADNAGASGGEGE